MRSPCVVALGGLFRAPLRAIIAGMRRFLPLLVLATLAACSTGPSAVTTSNGSAYRVSCGGPFSSKLDCNVQANKLCPSGFVPVSSPVGELVFTCSNRPVPANAPMDQ